MLPVLLLGGLFGLALAISRSKKASAASDEAELQKAAAAAAAAQKAKATAAAKKKAVTKKTVADIRAIESSFPTASAPTASKYDPTIRPGGFMIGDEDGRHL